MAQSFPAWLQDQLDNRDWKQADLVRASNGALKIATVSKWIRGVSKPEDQDLITILARTLRHSVEDVQRAIREEAASDVSPRSYEDILAELEANQPVAVPVIRDVVAHMGAGGGFIDDYVFLPPVYRRRRSKNILSLIAHGDCMAPQIEDGDIVVFDKDAPWKANDIVVAGIDGLAVIRRLVEVGGKAMLRADADGSTHSFSGVDNIFGRVIYVMRPLLAME